MQLGSILTDARVYLMTWNNNNNNNNNKINNNNNNNDNNNNDDDISSPMGDRTSAD